MEETEWVKFFTMKRRLNGVVWLLVYFNLAVMCLAMGFAPRKDLLLPDDLSGEIAFVMSREWGPFYWIMAASLLLSWGVRTFAARWLHESEESKEEMPDEDPPLHRAVSNRDFSEMEKLIEAGADVNEPNSRAYTPLMLAAEQDWTTDGKEIDGWTRGVQRLLEAGADVNAIGRQTKHSATSSLATTPEKQREFNEKPFAFEISAMNLASNLDIVHLLLEAGADIKQINSEMRSRYLGYKYEGAVICNREEYEQGKHPCEGVANPEKMEVSFWNAMVRSGARAFAVRKKFGDEYRAGDAPVWCFKRSGNTMTRLSDDRIIEIGGTSGDSSDDRDFHTYNDVLVHHGKGRFEIYGYPYSVFLPISDHTATLVSNDIYIIGNYGTDKDSRLGFTPVYRLNCDTLAIAEVPTTGENPGWISMHKATFHASQGDAGEIRLHSGRIKLTNTGKRWKDWTENKATFVLDLASLEWRREGEGNGGAHTR